MTPVSRSLWTALFLLAAGGVGVSGAESVDFIRHIRPILADACFHCHGPDPATREAKLRLDEREGLFRTRKDFTVVVPGDPEGSELFIRITSPHEDEVMPPKEASRQLKPGEIELLKKWIEEGAPWKAHWAFTPPVRPKVPVPPEAALADRIRNPIDAFVTERLVREGMAPAPEASRETLLRRVALDLNGVPPTPGEVDAFLADRAPDAYERAVDRMLASPRYGQRWAWDWLDIARYADTNGFQGDPERTMWPWRDWVVDALNANMPYDRFTIEQLAGDLLPDATREQKLATGFHRNTMFNGEGGRIAEETRVENVFDRVDTTSTTWLGMTFSCARCHDHKFDPIRQTDYYSFYDIFNQMSETGRNARGSRGQIPPLLDMSSEPERARLRKAEAALEAVAREVDEFERTKFPRPPGRPLRESPEADALPGNLPRTLARLEARNRSVDGLLEAIPYFEGRDANYTAHLHRLLEARRAADDANDAVTRVMVMDQLKNPRDTFVLDKGGYENKTAMQVFGAVPALFRAHPQAPGERLDLLGLSRRRIR